MVLEYRIGELMLKIGSADILLTTAFYPVALFAE